MIQNLKIINIKKFCDSRGIFLKLFGSKFLNKYKFNIREVNLVYNKKKNTFRGFHFQKRPFSEKKIVTVISGSIIDFSVNLNIKSKNFGKIYEYKISAKNPKMIKIPNYCAHGYLTLENNTTVIYFSDKAYQKKFEVAISYKDKDLNFKLKKKIKIASKKDKNGLSLKDFKSKI